MSKNSTKSLLESSKGSSRGQTAVLQVMVMMGAGGPPTEDTLALVDLDMPKKKRILSTGRGGKTNTHA